MKNSTEKYHNNDDRKPPTMKIGIGGTGLAVLGKAKEMLNREWWHRIIRNYGFHSCAAVFLTLPNDIVVNKYLAENQDELKILSGKYCLVLVLPPQDVKFLELGDELVGLGDELENGENDWEKAVNEQIYSGQNIEIAKYFDIGFTEFPCMLIFRKIHSPEHVKISLQEISVSEVSKTMREVFSIIQESILNKKDPLVALLNHSKKENSKKKRYQIISELSSFAGKTIENAMEAWIKSSLS
jgi:hypothetical protein